VGHRAIWGKVLLLWYDRGLFWGQGVSVASRISGSYGMNGSKGSASSIGLSGSSSGFSTGVGSWYSSIEEYSRQWMFHGMGTRGSTGG